MKMTGLRLTEKPTEATKDDGTAKEILRILRLHTENEGNPE